MFSGVGEGYTVNSEGCLKYCSELKWKRYQCFNGSWLTCTFLLGETTATEVINSIFSNDKDFLRNYVYVTNIRIYVCEAISLLSIRIIGHSQSYVQSICALGWGWWNSFLCSKFIIVSFLYILLKILILLAILTYIKTYFILSHSIIYELLIFPRWRQKVVKIFIIQMAFLEWSELYVMVERFAEIL